MPLREPKGARRFNDLITLTNTPVVYDEFHHASFGAPENVLDVWAMIRQMSSTKTMQTFQQADIVGVDIEMREPGVVFNGCTWRGHRIHFPHPESVDNRGRYVRISGWYQIDNPHQAPPPPTPPNNG